MYPEILRIGNFVISSYGVMVAIAFALAYYTSYLEFKRRKLPQDVLQDMLIAAVIGGLVGAKIMFILENVPLSEFFKNPFPYLFDRSGLTFYGGFVLAALLIVWVVKRKNQPLAIVADAVAPGLALAYGIGRIGCFLVGDDYGVACNLPWAVSFPRGAPPTPPGVKVHPTQLYETFTMLIVFAILWKLRKSKKPDGWLFGFYLVLAGSERFLVEFIRTTTPSPIPGLTWAQVIALVLIISGLVVLFTRKSASASTS